MKTSKHLCPDDTTTNITNDNTKQADRKHGAGANRDPITGTPGAHPVGTGVGAAGGAAVGLVAGAVTGGLVGKGVAETMDPTVEDAYWRTNYSKRSYVTKDSAYATYQPAYRTGYEGRRQYPGKKFEEVEANLKRDYEKSSAPAGLSWDKARSATRDAWNRVEKALPGDADEDGH